MIRREPTLIPMNDGDVQDVLAMIAKRLETLQSKAAIMKKIQSLAEGPGMSEEMIRQLLFEMKAKRLGLDSGVFNSASESSTSKVTDKSHRKVLSQLRIVMLYTSV